MDMLCLDESVSRGDKTTYASSANPIESDFEQRFHQDLHYLVNEHNVHKHTSTCYKYAKSNTKRPSCRMKMPRKVHEKSSIDPHSGLITMSSS